jgi:hypothetical protein
MTMVDEKVMHKTSWSKNIDALCYSTLLQIITPNHMAHCGNSNVCTYQGHSQIKGQIKYEGLCRHPMGITHFQNKTHPRTNKALNVKDNN